MANTVGDGLGFDILSFDDANDNERFIEVKTTGQGKFFPFYATATEVCCSEDTGDQYHRTECSTSGLASLVRADWFAPRELSAGAATVPGRYRALQRTRVITPTSMGSLAGLRIRGNDEGCLSPVLAPSNQMLDVLRTAVAVKSSSLPGQICATERIHHAIADPMMPQEDGNGT